MSGAHASRLPDCRAWTLLTCPRHVGRNRFASGVSGASASCSHAQDDSASDHDADLSWATTRVPAPHHILPRPYGITVLRITMVEECSGGSGRGYLGHRRP